MDKLPTDMKTFKVSTDQGKLKDALLLKVNIDVSKNDFVNKSFEGFQLFHMVSENDIKHLNLMVIEQMVRNYGVLLNTYYLSPINYTSVFEEMVSIVKDECSIDHSNFEIMKYLVELFMICINDISIYISNIDCESEYSLNNQSVESLLSLVEQNMKGIIRKHANKWPNQIS